VSSFGSRGLAGSFRILREKNVVRHKAQAISRLPVTTYSSADRDEICRARIDAGSLAELGDLVDESHDQMGPECLGEPT
jgi:hypothetical protein